ncbi:MAG: metal-dependent hydrolase [Elainellaceae cyanobacterium]
MTSITVRRIAFQFPASIQRYWLSGSPFRTHLMNSFTLALPLTERWAIRVLKRSLCRLSDTGVEQDVINFVGQEGQHAAAHAAFWDNLRQQGYATGGYVRAIESVLRRFEACFTPAFNCAILAGLEHLTECISDFGLRHDIFSGAEPKLKQLFEWHAAEEIEHKTVVYDAITSLKVGYLARILGLVISHIYVVAAIAFGTGILLWQDGLLVRRSIWADAVRLFWIEGFLFEVCENFGAYCRADFHPSQKDNADLAQAVFGDLAE